MVGFCQDGDEPWGSVTGGDFTYFLSCCQYVCVLLHFFDFLCFSFVFLCFSFVAHCLGVHTFCDAG